MKKENPDLNNNSNKNNSGDDNLFINISNSKSNSSKNQSSKNSSNNYKVSLTQNNNSSSNSKNNHQNSSLFNIIRQKLSSNNNDNNNNEEKSSELLYSLTENSFIKYGNDISIKNNSNKYSSKSLSEDKKENPSNIKMKESNITPQRKPKNNAVFFEKSKNINKAVLETKNVNGKNLMERFKEMSVNVSNEEKNKNRVSSAENISGQTLTLKNNYINTNEILNKKNINNINLPKKQIKNDNIIIQNNISKTNNKKEKEIIQKEMNLATFSGKNSKRSTSNIKKSPITNFQKFFKKNNYDFENLINKYKPK